MYIIISLLIPKPRISQLTLDQLYKATVHFGEKKISGFPGLNRATGFQESIEIHFPGISETNGSHSTMDLWFCLHAEEWAMWLGIKIILGLRCCSYACTKTNSFVAVVLFIFGWVYVLRLSAVFFFFALVGRSFIGIMLFYLIWLLQDSTKENLSFFVQSNQKNDHQNDLPLRLPFPRS